MRYLLLCLLLVGSAWAGAALGDRNERRLTEQPAFLPVTEAYQAWARLDDQGLLHIDWQIAEGYYLYRHSLSAQALGGTLNLQLPAGQAVEDEFFGQSEVYYRQLPMQVTLPTAQQPYTLSLHYQGCADAGLCYPPETRHWRIDPLQGSVVEQTGTNTPDTEALRQPHLWLALISAFLGGLILNLMPCVFPVLGLKLLSLGQSRQQALPQALAYSLGVIGSFLLVAALLIALKAGGAAIGWGFQLQSPGIVALLAWLFTGIGLALLGLFTPGLRWLGLHAGTGQQLTEGRHWPAAFFTGVLAVVVASPCTAPFMAAALGFALVQPAPVTLAVFAALGLGMALPFLTLGLLPGWRRLLPKPGPWMQTLQRALALPLFATVAWLLWVLYRQTGDAGLWLMAGGLLLLGLACWLLGQGRTRGPIIALLLLSLLPAALVQTRDTPTAITPETRLQMLRQQGPVLLNVTADWCLTCLANERLVLGTERGKRLLSEHGIQYLELDWTRQDAAITTLLARFGRSGVPLYVLFPADASQAGQILPQILTPALLESAILSINTQNKPVFQKIGDDR